MGHGLFQMFTKAVHMVEGDLVYGISWYFQFIVYEVFDCGFWIVGDT